MDRKVALISSFCDDKEKLDILNQNIKTLKSNDLDVILISPIIIPEETIKMCDYFFYTKDNPVLKWPIKTQIYWLYFPLNDGNFLFFNSQGDDYGWAGLNHIKKLTEIALSFDYDYFYNLIYDLDIDENIIKILNNPKDSLAFGFQRSGIHLKLSSLHFMVFNRQNAKLLSDLITLENYLDFLNFSGMKSGKDAESFFQGLRQYLNYDIGDFLVTDKIILRQDFFNHSKIKGIKFFIEKNASSPLSELKICVFENNLNKKIEIFVNDNGMEISETFKVFPLGVSFLEVESIYVKVDDEIMDLIPVLKTISNSFIEIKSSLD